MDEKYRNLQESKMGDGSDQEESVTDRLSNCLLMGLYLRDKTVALVSGCIYN